MDDIGIKCPECGSVTIQHWKFDRLYGVCIKCHNEHIILTKSHASFRLNLDCNMRVHNEERYLLPIPTRAIKAPFKH